MANMLEGGGKTPILSPKELERLGFKLVAYPLSLLGVSVRAMQQALNVLQSGMLPPPMALPTFPVPDLRTKLFGSSGSSRCGLLAPFCIFLTANHSIHPLHVLALR